MVSKGLLNIRQVLASRSMAVAALACALALLASGPGAAEGKMRSTKLGPGVCETTGGGRFVRIPGFPGEKIDRRLLRDVRLLQRKYQIFVTDGYSTDPVHSANGEHPIGLALDIAPDSAAGGTWAEITALANWAEPAQNAPRMPFRWVGYNGDAGHGRGHHLHLSWAHSPTKFNEPARTVYTLRCPKPRGDQPDEPKGSKDPKGTKGGGSSGGVQANRGKRYSTSSGGTHPRYAGPSEIAMAPVAAESNGVDG